jgi:hypothetical protein
MPTLTIDYRTDGERRGYGFATPTEGVDPAAVKAIWRHAMPRGQGWDDPALRGARALKAFPLHTGEIALCDVTVTDARDEMGRAGIRHAEIALRSPRDHDAHLRARLADMPADVVALAERRLNSHEWALMFRKQRGSHPPRSVVKPQTILAFPYTTPDAWQFVEACILLLAARLTPLSNLLEVSPSVNPFADRALSFTTLALDYRDETRLIAVPLERAAAWRDVPLIRLT